VSGSLSTDLRRLPVQMLADKVARLFQRRGSASSPPPDVAFSGDFPCWSDAQRQCAGYSAPVILERTCAALLKVKRGEAVYERDSVLFDTPQYRFSVLAGLLRAGLAAGGRLSVVDFGGSLGSSYFQCRRFLDTATSVEWSVIEQPEYVRCGREQFADGELRFYETVDECLATRQPAVLLLSGVLQYLDDPYGALDRLLSHRIGHVIMDRTPFLASGRDRITIQTIPEWIYPASYPAWFFSEAKVGRALTAAGYSLVSEFAGADTVSLPDEPAYFKGFLYDQAAR
jgi:putative methyltransferase (TIGR04325 family)